MVIDTVCDFSGVGSLLGRTGGMKITRPVHSSQRPEAKVPLLSPGMDAMKKGVVNTDPDSKPCFVIRRRIMVRQSEEADEAAGGRIHGPAPALPNEPIPLRTASENLSPANLDLSQTKHCDDMAFARSSSTTTQDQVADCTDTLKTKPRKMLRLFDLNKVPSLQENLWSATSSSPTSTVVSADSTSHFTADHASTSAMATRSDFLMVDTDAFFGASPSSSSMKRSRRDDGDDQARRGALAVDLGLLAPASETTTRRHSIGVDSRHRGDRQFAFWKPQQQQQQQPCAVEMGATDAPGTPARKRLRRLSEYAGGHSSTTSMAKSWTTGEGDGCNNRDVTKTFGPAASQADAKVRRCRPDDDDDDEVRGAVAALRMLSSAPRRLRRRDVPRFSSRGEASSAPNGRSTFADSHMDDLAQRQEATRAARPDLAAAASDDDDDDAPSRSVGSGSSVLLRPQNKQRYRSMAEIMAHTPILMRRRA